MRKLLLVLLFAWLILAMPLYGQVPVSLSPPPKFQFLNQGAIMPSACLFSYASGTTTPQSTYTSSAGTATNPNPTILDANGSANIWLTSQGYKLALYTWDGANDNCATGTLVW